MTNATPRSLLGVCLRAFNEIPNQDLRREPKLTSTYAVAGAIGALLAGSSRVQHELEIMLCGMKADPDSEGDMTLADTEAEVLYWDLDLRIKFPDTGQIDILLEREEMSEREAKSLLHTLDMLFPDAEMTVIPDR